MKNQVHQINPRKRPRTPDDDEPNVSLRKRRKSLEPDLKSPRFLPPIQTVKLLKEKSSRSWNGSTSKSCRSRIPTPIFPMERPKSCIPAISNDLTQNSRYIDISDVAKLVRGDRRLTIGGHDRNFCDVKIIDARYKYEFAGGHINGM